MQLPLAERRIIAAFRDHKFHALTEVNEAIADLLEKLSHRPFRKREGSRASLFAELGRPALQPLPTQRARQFRLSQYDSVPAHAQSHAGLSRVLGHSWEPSGDAPDL